MSNPAARKTDPHTCPQVEVTPGTCCNSNAPHVGGPILGECSGDVNINNLRAARVGDKASCQGARPVDILSTGASTVLINGRFAAVVTSRTTHTGEVVKGSPDVNIGGPVAGAVFGDGAAGTRACKQAAAKRRNGMKTPGDESQGKDMNCGHESVRQLCIQKCGGCAPKGKDRSCEACDATEDEWYDRYFQPADKGGMVDEHNKVNGEYNAKIRAENDAAWAQARAAAVVQSGDSVINAKTGSWESHQGETLRLFASQEDHDNAVLKNSALVKIKRLGTEIKDPDSEKKYGGVGSFPETRKKMLKDWCGLDSEVRENKMDDIVDAMAGGKTVIASVDVGRLNNDKGVSGQHAVTVTEVRFNDDGSIQEVTYNDTSQANGCGRSLKGADASRFEKALTPGAQTNAV